MTFTEHPDYDPAAFRAERARHMPYAMKKNGNIIAFTRSYNLALQNFHEGFVDEVEWIHSHEPGPYTNKE